MSYLEGKVVRLTIKLIVNLTVLITNGRLYSWLTRICEVSNCGIVWVHP
jgi:hypothetical protein